jgi:sec-independent protein translocase protein TatA
MIRARGRPASVARRAAVFGSLGGPEIIFIFVLALLLFGPRKLPEVGRTLGRALSEFRKATHEFRGSLEREIEVEELKRTREELQSADREIAATLGPPSAVARRPGQPAQPGAGSPRAPGPSGVSEAAEPDRPPKEAVSSPEPGSPATDVTGAGPTPPTNAGPDPER